MFQHNKKMPSASIADIQKKLGDFHRFARKPSHDAADYKREWERLFGAPMSTTSANSFEHYYKDMRSKSTRRRQRGGNAPVGSIGMGPGLNVQNYGHFPVEIGMDPASIRNLDVFFQDSVRCGSEDSSRTVPADMGSNQVGAGRRRRSQRRRRNAAAATARKGRRGVRRTYKQRGGNLLESLSMRAPFIYNATPYPNPVQAANHWWSGSTSAVPVSGNPEHHTWQTQSSGLVGTVNPGIVSPLPSDLSRLASPPPWSATTQ